MAAFFLNEKQVRDLVTMSDAIEVVEQAFGDWADESAANVPRQRLRADDTMLHVLAGANQQRSQLGWKIYTTTKTGARFLVGLYDTNSGELAAIMEADWLGQLRTAAASAVASKYLARTDSKTLGVIGSGLQARTQIWALCEQFEFETVQVYSRDQKRRNRFARDLCEEVGQEVTPVESARKLVQSADIVVTATTSKTAVFDGTDLQPGTHINAIGSNFLRKSELDLTSLERVTLAVCDSREQCRLEAGELQQAVEAGVLDWSDIHELKEVVAGRVQRKDAEQITLFKSVGLGLQDVALGSVVLERAQGAGIGQPLPF